MTGVRTCALPIYGARWKGTAGTVVVSSEELSSPYACPSYQPGGTAEELTADDARLLLTRIVGIAEGSPVRSGDDGHYDLFCQDWRTFTTPAMTASLHMMLEGDGGSWARRTGFRRARS